MNGKITHFTQSTFELESFKAILVEIFPQIHFIEPNKRTLPHSILKSQTAICENFKLSNKNFDIYIFECESIRAKVGIHTELKSILKHAGLDAILAIFHTPDSTSLARDDSILSPSLVKEPHPKSLPQGEGFSLVSTSLARGDSTLSPSLAEGDKGGGLSLQTSEASVAIQNKSIDCHEDSTNPLAMTKKANSKIFDENDNRATQCGSILDETQRVASETKQKSWLRSHERENKTKASIDEASGKLHDLSLKDNAPKEFRLSLITSGYDYELNKPTYSNLKRQSFILGHTKTATAQKALAELIKKAQKSPLTQNDLEEAFSQEPVSKEFYERYKKHYDAICAKLTQANIAYIFANYKGISDSHKAIESFAKKLLGRIVFLYFLQKKGYLGVPRDKSYGEGDTNFLHNLFCKARQQNINFYSEYLSPLFFDSLNARKEDDYSALFDCKIPFLNGGLFEDEFANNKSCHIERSEISKTSICHTEALAEVSQVSQNRDISVSTKPQYDNATIFRANKAHFLIAQVLDNPTFEAIFDFFESYNFTIEESTPTDIEVSIDPEMLGKVFENLIDYNKESGAFYTPREIVHYMAQSALIAHFSRHYPSHKEQIQNLIANKQSDNDFIHKNGAEIKAILLNLKILDPAIGSGAFPMGILSEIMQVLETLDKTMSDAQKAQHKRDIIANCIYGIDIDADAIAIARLRFWLSIAVDEVSPSPLPNLDFKFMQGNSLLESLSVGKECIEIIPRDFIREIPSTKLFDENADKIIFSHDIAKSLQNLFLDYYAQNDAHKKHTLKSQIKSIMSNAFEVRIAQIQKDIDSKTKELSTPNNDKTKKRLTNEIDSLLHQIPALQSLADDFITNDFHTDKVFLYNFFFANIIKEGGFDIVIGNPPYGAKITENERENYKKIYNISSSNTAQFFILKAQTLLKPNGINTFIVPKSLTYVNKWKPLRDSLQDYLVLLADCSTAFDNVKLEAVVYLMQNGTKRDSYNLILYENKQFLDFQSTISREIIDLFGIFPNGVNSGELALGIKICKIGDKLGKYCENIGGSSFQNQLKEKGKYAFIGGKEISRYGIKNAKGFCDDISKLPNHARIVPNSLLVQDIVAHIENPKPHIKIVALLPDSRKVFLLNTINQLVFENLDSRLAWAILNSMLINWYVYKFIFANSIRTMHLNAQATDKIPIPKITKENQNLADEIVNLVDTILEAKNLCHTELSQESEVSQSTKEIFCSAQNDNKDISVSAKPQYDTKIKDLQSQIDSLVYALYELDSNEIQIIESKTH